MPRRRLDRRCRDRRRDRKVPSRWSVETIGDASSASSGGHRGGRLTCVTTVLSVVALAAVALVVLGALLRLRQRRSFDTPRERAVHDTLHTAALAAPALRRGLSPESAAEGAPHLRQLLGTAATALTGPDGALLAWHGSGEQHVEHLQAAAARAASRGRRELLDHAEFDCGRLDCPVRALVVVPLVPAGNGVVGVLGAVSTVAAGPGLLRAAGEVARYASSQIELAELDENRTRLASAEVRALRAQSVRTSSTTL